MYTYLTTRCIMRKSYLPHIRRAVLLSLVLGGTFGVSPVAGALDGTALPTEAQNVTNATVSRNGAVMDITQTKGQQTAYISWESFNIGKDATVNVKQHTGADTLINAVRGNAMSEIAGKLNASGNVVLVNPNGVIFHDGAQVNVGGLGVYATGYDYTNKKVINSGSEGNITIEKGVTINAGVGAALSNINAWGMASDYAIAIDSTSEDGYTDRIHLVAEGNVEIHDGSTMTAKDTTYVGSKKVVGAEGFATGAQASGMSGKIYIRTDRDSDDYGSLIVTHGTDSSSTKPVIESARGVSIYANAPQADGDTTKEGIQAASRVESDGTVSYYTKRDYKSMADYSGDFTLSSYTDGSDVSVEGAGTTADKLTNSSTDANHVLGTYSGTSQKSNVDTRILINNMDQLQDIGDAVTTYSKSDGTTGTHITGNYVLGRDMNATDDEHSFIDDGILYKMVDGKIVKMSVNDRGTITYDSTTSTATKTLTDGTALSYSGGTASTRVSTGETLSQKGTTVSASNTAGYSTNKGASTVTSGSDTYTVSGKTVSKGDFTSATDTNTVTTTSGSYTVVADGSTTQTVTSSDGTVSDIKNSTVTKIGGTEGTGASITAHSDTEKKGTVTTGGSTYTVDNTTVSKDGTTVNGDTVTLHNKASTVDLTKNSVATSTTSTSVTAKDTKTGTVTYTADSQAVSVDNGTASYTASDGTSYTVKSGTITTTSGSTSKTASISDTAVTVDDHSVAVSGGKTTGVVTETVDGSSVSTSLTGKTITKGDAVIGVTVADDGTASASTVTTGSGTGAATVSLSDSTVTYGNGTKVSGTTVTMGTTTAVVDNTASTVTIGDNAAVVNGNTVTVGTVSSTVSGSTVTTGDVTVSGNTVTNGTESTTDLSAHTVTIGSDTYLVTETTGTDGSTTKTVTLSGNTVDDTVANHILSIYTSADTSLTAANTVLAYKSDADSAKTAYTNSLTAISHAKTVSDGTDVKTIWSGAAAAKADADSALSAYAIGTGALSAMDSAVTDLSAAASAKTSADSALTTFNDAVSRLETDITRYKEGVTTLSSAKTALSNYTSLQDVLTKTADLQGKLSTAYSEFQSSHLTDTAIKNINSAKWDGDKGFRPIGSTDTPFVGTLDGFSGETTRTITNLTIHRGDEDNVGLVGAAAGAHFYNLHLNNVDVVGKSSVGALAGSMDSSTISWSFIDRDSTANKGVRTGSFGAASDIGGMVGKMTGGRIDDSANYTTVTGTSDDSTVDVSHTGGLAGSVSGGAVLSDVRNMGKVTGEKDTGGLAGYVENSQIVGSGSQLTDFYNTYNNGTVTGDTNTGGIAGRASGIYLYGVFNTNEDRILSPRSQIFVKDDNTMIKRGDGTTTEAGQLITADGLKSTYGAVTGSTNTGGLVGYLEKADGFSLTVKNKNISSTSTTDADGNVTVTAKDATITENVLDTVYNAGNVKGTTATGGLVGRMDGGTISNAYNGDNNTVLREELTIPDLITSTKTWTSPYDSTAKFTYSATKVSADQDATQYYSFFTLNSDGTRNYYYFIPAEVTTDSSTGAVTSKGAGGIFVHQVGSDMRIVTDNGTYNETTKTWDTTDTLPGASERYYMNRIFNKDANVTGNADTGGLVGTLSSASGAAAYGKGSVITSAYDSGTVTGSTNTGALVGAKDANGLVQESFFVTGSDGSTKKAYSGQTAAVGSDGSTANTKTTDGLTAVQSKQKYSVGKSGSDKRGNFPAMQQDTWTGTVTGSTTSGTYYKYATGDGTYLTDVDMETKGLDGLTTIYSMTTTTLDTTTGKNVSTTTVQSAFTRDTTKTGGIYFKDSGGVEYTATYSETNNQIILTPVYSDTSTTNRNVVTFNAVLKARSANETWVVYENQTTPLLTYYLNSANLNREFTYDGTTHNLKTDDVDNLYGRADFDGDAGKAVQLSNFQLSKNGISSEYTYDNTSIWSPQHGYFMDPESTLIINPVNMTAKIIGKRMYGDIYNTKDYYVCVPYTTTDGQRYAFYKLVQDKDKKTSSYQLLTNTDTDSTLDNFFASYASDTEKSSHLYTEDTLLKKAAKEGFYVLELNGFVNGEGASKLDDVITGLLQTMGTSSSDITSGHDLQHLFTKQGYDRDSELDAGIYKVTNEQITGLTATNQDYTINYDGYLEVDQAPLYFTYEGSRTYGDRNRNGTHAYYLVGVDDATATDGSGTSTRGFLKNWDLSGKTYTYTYKDSNGTEKTITLDNPYAGFFEEGSDGKYLIKQDKIGITGYQAEKTTTTHDVTKGTSETVTEKDDSKSADLDAIYDNLKGRINENSIVDTTDRDAKTVKQIGSYSDSNTSSDLYSHVLVDKDGNTIGYKVTTFEDGETTLPDGTAKKAEGTIQLVIIDSGAKETADSDALKAAIARFNNNYKLTWKEGGTYDKVYTTYSATDSAKSPSGLQTEKRGLTVKDSTFTINPKEATVTITGQRTYGDAMDTAGYTTTTGTSVPQPGTLAAGKYNLNIDGLVNNDTVSVLDDSSVKTLLGHVENQDSSTHINKKTHAGTYDLKDGTATPSDSLINVSTKGDANHYTLLAGGNYDYALANGDHSLLINRADLTVNVNGTGTYGMALTGADYTVTAGDGMLKNGETLALSSPTNTFDTAKTVGAAGRYTNGWTDTKVAKDTASAATGSGTYINTAGVRSGSSTGETTTAGIRSVTLTDAGNTGFDASNYNITYNTTLTINPAKLKVNVSGNKIYGQDGTTDAITVTGNVAAGDTFSADNFTNTLEKYADAGTYTHQWSSYTTDSALKDTSSYTGEGTSSSFTTKWQDTDSFRYNNYDVDFKTSYTVNKRPLYVDVTTTSTYGEGQNDYRYTIKAAADSSMDRGLVDKQKFNTDGFTVATVTDDLDGTADAGTYIRTINKEKTAYTQTSAGEGTAFKGITKVAGTAEFKDSGSLGSTTFKVSNYELRLNNSSHIVNPKALTIYGKGSKIYGQANGESQYDTIALRAEGLVNGETIDFTNTKNPLSYTLDSSITETSDAGTYKNGILSVNNWEGHPAAVQQGKGDNFKAKNYSITYDTDYTIGKRTVRVTVDGAQTYGETAPAEGTKYKVAFDRAGGENVAPAEGLIAKDQGIAKSQVTIANTVGATNDAGTYTTSQSAVGASIVYDSRNPERVDGKDQGITGITVTDGNGFKNGNYDVVLKQGTYTVKPKDVTLTITGSKTYGDDTSVSGKDYTISGPDGFANGEKFESDTVNVITSVGRLDDAGHYDHSFTGYGNTDRAITGIDFQNAKVTSGDFKPGNYHISYSTDYEIRKRPLKVYVSGESAYGSAGQTKYSYDYSGNDGSPSEGFVDNQRFDEGQVKVDNRTGNTYDAGTYVNNGSGTMSGTGETGTNGKVLDGIMGISGLKDRNQSGFKVSNYDVIMTGSTQTVTPKKVTLTLSGSKTYGDDTPVSGSAYALSGTLANGETFRKDSAEVVNTVAKYDDVGIYRKASDNTFTFDNSQGTRGIVGFKAGTLKAETGDFKEKNYDISYVTDFTVKPKDVAVTISGKKTYGETGSTRGKDYDFTFTYDGTDHKDLTLLNGQKVKKEDVAVTNTGADAATHAGTYHDKISLAGQPAFTADSTGTYTTYKASNYHFTNAVGDNTYTVDPAALTITIKGSKDYGQLNQVSGKVYTISSTGLQNKEKADWTKGTVVNTVRQFQDKGTYYLHTSGQQELVEKDEKGNDVTRAILGIREVDEGKDTLGFDPTNYRISYSTDYTVNPKGLTILTEGSKTYGDSSVDAKSITFTDRGGSIFDRDKALWDDYMDTLHQMIYSTGDFNRTDLHAGTYGSTTKTKDIQEVEVGKPMLVFSDGDKEKIAAHFSNYNVSYSDTAKVNPKAITIDVSGRGTYGDAVSTSGRDYTIVVNGGKDLPNRETFDHDRVTVLNNTDAFDNGGTYGWEGKAGREGTYGYTPNVRGNGVEGRNAGITGIDKASMHQGAFDPDNYDITYHTAYTMEQRPVTITQKGTRRMGGLPAYTLFDPMTVTNVPDRDLSLFYDGYHREDVSEISTAAGFHLGHISPDGTYDGMIHGWFTDPRILNNYAITGDTSLQITPSKDLDAAISLLRPMGGTPARQPILDIRYLSVEGDGINRHLDSGAVPVRTAFGEDRDLTVKGDGIRRFGDNGEATGELILTRDGKKDLVDEIYRML